MKRWLLAVVVSLLVVGAVSSVHAVGCDANAGTSLTDGCLYTITGGDTADPTDGFPVVNTATIPWYTCVSTLKLQDVGYPIAQPFEFNGFQILALQKVMLQYRPDYANTGPCSQFAYLNTMDLLANSFGVNLGGVPAHTVLPEDEGASWAQIEANHLALLDQNAVIKAKFFEKSNWIDLYGLPIAYEAQEINGNPQGAEVLRAQRAVWRIFNVEAPGTAIGVPHLLNVPDMIKQQLDDVIIPGSAKTPIGGTPDNPNDLISSAGLATGEECWGFTSSWDQGVTWVGSLLGAPLPRYFCYVAAVDWWPQGWSVRSRWTFDDGRVDETDARTPCAGTRCGAGYLRQTWNNSNWVSQPAGTLRIDLIVNDTVVRTDTFTVTGFTAIPGPDDKNPRLVGDFRILEPADQQRINTHDALIDLVVRWAAPAYGLGDRTVVIGSFHQWVFEGMALGVTWGDGTQEVWVKRSCWAAGSTTITRSNWTALFTSMSPHRYSPGTYTITVSLIKLQQPYLIGILDACSFSWGELTREVLAVRQATIVVGQ